MAVRLISSSNEPYMTKLKKLNLETLKDRRNKLSEKFAEKCVKIETNKQMFKLHKKTHTMKLRHNHKYAIQNVKTVRMQNILIRSIENQNYKILIHSQCTSEL